MKQSRLLHLGLLSFILIVVITIGLVSCSNFSIPDTVATLVKQVTVELIYFTQTPTIVPTVTSTPTISPTDAVINSDLVDAYKVAYVDPRNVLSKTEPGVEIAPEYIITHATQDPLQVPGYSDQSLPSQAVKTIVQDIDSYSQAVEDIIGNKPTNFKVNWNKQIGDKFAFTIYGTEELNGKQVMFWAADINKAGTADHPFLSFNPFPPDFGVALPRSVKLIPIELPPGAVASNLHARWWPSGTSDLLKIPAIVITVSNLEFHLYDVTKSQPDGNIGGWNSVLRPTSIGIPNLGNNTWKIIAVQESSISDWSSIAIINPEDGSIIYVPPVSRYSTVFGDPAGSPDGKHIVFDADFLSHLSTGGHYFPEIFVTNSDGTSRPTQLTNWTMTILDSLTWSPDSQRIAFLASKTPIIDSPNFNPIFQLYAMNANGTGLTQLTKLSGGVDSGAISWTSDSKGIIYPVSGQCIEISLDRTALTSKMVPQLHQMLQQPHRLYYPGCGNEGYSPDGKKIAYEIFNGDNDIQIWVENSDGSNQTQLTNIPDSVNTDPTWSPDGNYIVFNTNRYGDSELWVMKPDGSDQTLLKPGIFVELQCKP